MLLKSTNSNIIQCGHFGQVFVSNPTLKGYQYLSTAIHTFFCPKLFTKVVKLLVQAISIPLSWPIQWAIYLNEISRLYAALVCLNNSYLSHFGKQFGAEKCVNCSTQILISLQYVCSMQVVPKFEMHLWCQRLSDVPPMNIITLRLNKS